MEHRVCGFAFHFFLLLSCNFCVVLTSVIFRGGFQNQGYPERKELRKIFPWRPLSAREQSWALQRSAAEGNLEIISNSTMNFLLFQGLPVLVNLFCGTHRKSSIPNLRSCCSFPLPTGWGGAVCRWDVPSWRDEFLGTVGDWTEN